MENILSAKAATAAAESPAAVMDVDSPAPATSPPILLQEIQLNSKYHVDRERWFELLQDDGLVMSADDKELFGTPSKGKRSNKHYNIAYCKFFYPKLYQLAHLVVGKIKEFPNAYPRFNHKSKNLSAIIHPLGLHIAHNRKSYARADVQKLGRDVAFNDLIESSAYEDRETFYILSQQQLLEYIFADKGGDN